MITTEELELELNPEQNPKKFLVANYPGPAARAIKHGTATVQANLTEPYRAMQNTISGLVLSREASEGQTNFDVPDWLVVTGGYVWRNLDCVWKDRKRMESESFTYVPAVEASGEDPAVPAHIVLDDGAVEGDTFVAEFFHDGTSVPELVKGFCLSVASYYVLTKIQRLMAEVDRGTLETENMGVRDDLRRLSRGQLRINEWDKLDLLDELETVNPPGQHDMIPNW